jgi:hypothetical protein
VRCPLPASRNQDRFAIRGDAPILREFVKAVNRTSRKLVGSDFVDEQSLSSNGEACYDLPLSIDPFIVREIMDDSCHGKRPQWVKLGSA